MQGRRAASHRAWAACISVKSRCACAFLQLSKVPASAAVGIGSIIALVRVIKLWSVSRCPPPAWAELYSVQCLLATAVSMLMQTLWVLGGCLRPAHS